MVVLAAVLGLNTADLGMVGAVAAQLEPALHIGQTRLGLLATVSGVMGLVAAPIAGVLADRTGRVRLLTWAIAGWTAAMVAGGLATSYVWLLGSRVLLGALVAAASPLVASLIGDMFPAEERARAYGWILTGEIVGSGVGLLTGGILGVVFSWRAPFFALAIVSGGLAAVLVRVLPEPARTGTDARPLTFWSAARYVLSIATVRNIIIASAVGYFFFAGLRTFAVIFAIRRFDLDDGVVLVPIVLIGASALVGVIAGGRLADAANSRGHPAARVTLPALAYLGAAVIFVPSLLSSQILPALAAGMVGGLVLAAANAPLDAARLDVVPAWLWGRAESVRTILRLVGEAIAPLLFGVVADRTGGQAGGGLGLRNAFLVMLLPLALNGLILLRTRGRYVADKQATG
jgi:predicted MFS family arabinose efflux permease